MANLIYGATTAVTFKHLTLKAIYPQLLPQSATELDELRRVRPWRPRHLLVVFCDGCGSPLTHSPRVICSPSKVLDRHAKLSAELSRFSGISLVSAPSSRIRERESALKEE